MNCLVKASAGSPVPLQVDDDGGPTAQEPGVSRSNDQKRESAKPLDRTKALSASMFCRVVTSSWVSAWPMSCVSPMWLNGIPDCWLRACAAAMADWPISHLPLETTQLLVLVDP